MNVTPAKVERRQTLGEEIANAVSHGIGLIAALVAAPFLISSAVKKNSALPIAGAGVFAAALVLMFLASTLYHSFPVGKTKTVFRTLDHGAIFILIAGTYTPLTLGVLHGPWGWTLFGLVWGLAIIGVSAQTCGGLRPAFLSTGLYLVMGWLVLIAIRPLCSLMPSSGFLWLLAGGIAYTVGVAFYAAKRVPYAHAAWHFFVIAGAAFHFFAILRYA